jgi:hypothetical protein
VDQSAQLVDRLAEPCVDRIDRRAPRWRVGDVLASGGDAQHEQCEAGLDAVVEIARDPATLVISGRDHPRS